MGIQIEAVVEFYGRFALESRRERDRLHVDADHQLAGEQIKSFLREKYEIIPPYNLLMNGRVWRCGEQELLYDGCRFKIIPIS